MVTRRRRTSARPSWPCIRGNIVAHLLSMSEPDATADGEAAANPTSSDAGPDGAGAAAAAPPVAGRTAAAHLARRPRGRRGHRPGGGAGRRPHLGQLLRDHAGGRHAGRAVHRRAGRGQPSPHRQDPADRRLRHPAERAQLPAVPVLRLGQRGDLRPGPARSHAEREPVSRPGLPRRWPRPSRSPPRRRCPTSATRSPRPTPARSSTGSSPTRRRPRRCTWPR